MERRVQTRKMELTKIIGTRNLNNDITEQYERMERSNGWTNERKQLEQKLQDVTEQLEEEEHATTKITN